MADEIYTTEERPRDTVVVEHEGSKSNAGLIVLAVIVILLLIFFLIGNPFSGGGDGADVNVDVPAPTVTTPEATPEAQ